MILEAYPIVEVEESDGRGMGNGRGMGAIAARRGRRWLPLLSGDRNDDIAGFDDGVGGFAFCQF